MPKSHKIAPELKAEVGDHLKETISAGDTFLVYMDTNDVIKWTTLPEHDTFGEDFSSIRSQVIQWQNICNDIFSKDKAYNFKCELALSYNAILENTDNKEAQRIIDLVSAKIQQAGKEVLRKEYLSGSFLTAAIFGSIALLIFLIRILSSGSAFSLNELDQVFLASVFGAMGALSTTITRSANYEPSIISGKSIHQLDGAFRIVYGVIAAILLIIGIKANLILGILNSTMSSNIYALIFLGAMAGASEIILPNIIKQTESNINTGTQDGRKGSK